MKINQTVALVACLGLWVCHGLMSEAHAFGPKKKETQITPTTWASADAQYGVPTLSGTGCGGSSGAVVTPDGRAVSILFDRMSVEAGWGAPAGADSKKCVARIPVRVPEGFQLIVSSADYRGASGMSRGATGSLDIRYEIQDAGSTSEASSAQRNFRGNSESDFTLLHQNIPLTTGCGGEATIILTADLRVTPGIENQHSWITLDSLDFHSKSNVSLFVTQKRCGKRNGSRHTPPNKVERVPTDSIPRHRKEQSSPRSATPRLRLI